jgi:hypothetical protein
MFGTTFLKRNKSNDIRFLDREAYRSQRRQNQHQDSEFKLSPQDALKVDFCTVSEQSSFNSQRVFPSSPASTFADVIPYSPSGYSFAPPRQVKKEPVKANENKAVSADEEFITVDQASHKQTPPQFFYTSDRAYTHKFRINDIDYLETSAVSQTEETGFIEPEIDYDLFVGAEKTRFCAKEFISVQTGIPELGVFSDSKIYSAFVKSELDKLSVNVKHFNHPATFSKSFPAEYDAINGWIIFLSCEEESNFLDEFLDRFIEKPALFLVPKLSRKSASRAIEQFIEELNT